MLFGVFSVLGCALFIPGGALFISRGCRIHLHPALIIPRLGLNWSPGMNRSPYLNNFIEKPCLISLSFFLTMPPGLLGCFPYLLMLHIIGGCIFDTVPKFASPPLAAGGVQRCSAAEIHAVGNSKANESSRCKAGCMNQMVQNRVRV